LGHLFSQNDIFLMYASNKVLQNPHEVEREIVSVMSYQSFTLLTEILLVPFIIVWLLKIKMYTAGFPERSLSERIF